MPACHLVSWQTRSDLEPNLCIWQCAKQARSCSVVVSACETVILLTTFLRTGYLQGALQALQDRHVQDLSC